MICPWRNRRVQSCEIDLRVVTCKFSCGYGPRNGRQEAAEPPPPGAHLLVYGKAFLSRVGVRTAYVSCPMIACCSCRYVTSIVLLRSNLHICTCTFHDCGIWGLVMCTKKSNPRGITQLQNHDVSDALNHAIAWFFFSGPCGPCGQLQ